MTDKVSPYWQDNLRILKILLTIWFIVSFLLAIVFADALNEFRMGGFRLGFWFAQQGAVYCYVVLIFVYIGLMNRLDRRYKVDQASLDQKQSALHAGE